ncbi:hypothetical protein [Achromobacter kerstersii]|uniref:hypothetical protein n=1 Tax=Achromobacter kerstersii TaxID=1353890 RepID=UPI00313AEAC5
MSDNQTIIEEHKKKMPVFSNQLFHYGCIILLSILLGLGLYQLVDMPAGLSPSDEKDLRLAYGLVLGMAIAFVGSAAYLGWTSIRIWRATKQAEKDLFEASMNRIRNRKSA